MSARVCARARRPLPDIAVSAAALAANRLPKRKQRVPRFERIGAFLYRLCKGPYTVCQISLGRIMIDNNQFEFAKSVNEKTIDLSTTVLRSLLLIHGGGAVALLSFIAAISGNDNLKLGGKIVALATPLMWFGWGIVATIAAMICAYFTNLFTVGHAFAEGGSASETRNRRAKAALHFLAGMAVLASVGLFLCGLSNVRRAITTELSLSTPVTKPCSPGAALTKPGAVPN